MLNVSASRLWRTTGLRFLNLFTTPGIIPYTHVSLVSPPGAPSIVQIHGTRQSCGCLSENLFFATRCSTSERHFARTPLESANESKKCARVYSANELTWSAAFKAPWRMPLTWWVKRSVGYDDVDGKDDENVCYRATASRPCVSR